ncbi:MAG: TonB C-terminal domain-containing protein [Tepidimonas taiwanensis]|nr:TonB C-terminal domain-containing protein [Tepidimonas taiwanensis]
MTAVAPILREGGRWALAGALVLVAHGAVAAWLSRQVPAGTVAGGPEVVLIELVPAMAPKASAPDLPEDAGDAAQRAPSDPAPTTAEPPPQRAPADATQPAEPTVEPTVEPHVEPTAEPDASPPTPAPDAAALIASARPAPRPPRPQPQTGRSARARPAAASTPRPQTTTSAAQDAAPARAGNARPSGPGAATARASAAQIQSWQAQVQTRVARHMQRTRLAAGRGNVRAQLALRIAADGRTSATLATSTGDPRIDAALSRQAGTMPRLPPPPEGRAVNLTVPVLVRLGG